MRCLTRKSNLTLLTTIAAFALGATVALADSLTLIPTLTGDTSNQGLAITPDGKYVVGLSGSRGYLYDVVGGTAISVLSSDNAQATTANGVGYRTSGGQTQIIISGLSSGYETEWMTADGGTTFDVKRRATSFAYNSMGAVNQLGSALGSDTYYVATSQNANNTPVYLNQGSGAWPAAIAYSSKGISSGIANMNSVGASGRAVGYRTVSGVKNNYMLTWTGPGTPANTYFAGLAGNNVGEAFSVSGDGTIIFGRSPVTVGGTTLYGYKATFSGTTEISIGQLPDLAGPGGSTSMATPYGSSFDGKYAVGMDYGLGMERAVLWNTSQVNPLDWTVMDLTQLATDGGILDGFNRLYRAYSVGVEWDENAMETYAVVTGVGYWSPDGGVTPYETRAFVMTVLVPEPTTGALLGLGLLGLFIFRRRK